MLRIRDYSITKKLTWMNMLVSGAALLLACGAFIAYETVLYRQTMVRDLSVQAQIIGDNSVSALLFNDPQLGREHLGGAPGCLARYLRMDLHPGRPAFRGLLARPKCPAAGITPHPHQTRQKPIGSRMGS